MIQPTNEHYFVTHHLVTFSLYSLYHPLWVALQNTQDIWNKTLGNIKIQWEKKKAKWSEIKCFYIQVWLAFYWSFPLRKIISKAPCYHNLSVWWENSQQEGLVLREYCLWAGAWTIPSVCAGSCVCWAWLGAGAWLSLELCYCSGHWQQPLLNLCAEHGSPHWVLCSPSFLN